MTKIVANIPDGTVMVDDDIRQVDIANIAIQKVLRKLERVTVLRWEEGSGYIERHQGLSESHSDDSIIQPFLKAHGVARREDDRRFKEAKRLIKEEQAAEAKEEQKREAELKAEADERDARQLREQATNDAHLMLGTSDIVILRLTEAGLPIPDSWKVYREALRKIVRDAPPNPVTVKWPRTPPKPKGLT